MKNVLYYASVFILLVACQKQQYFTSSQEIDLVKKGQQAFIAQDWEGLRALYSDTAKILVNKWDEPPITADEYVALMKNGAVNYTGAAFSETTIHEMIVSENGEKWVHTWTGWRATYNNSTEVKVAVHSATQIVGDKIVFQGDIYNTLPMYLAANPPAAVDSTKAP